MKRIERKGMRNVPRLQILSNRQVPENRAQAVTEFARLEHEKTRLENELRLWQSKELRTLERLKLVEERLDSLQQMLELVTKPAANRARGSQASPHPDPADDPQNPPWREMMLEY